MKELTEFHHQSSAANLLLMNSKEQIKATYMKVNYWKQRDLGKDSSTENVFKISRNQSKMPFIHLNITELILDFTKLETPRVNQ